MNDCAIYIFQNPDEQGSDIWIYRREGHYLVNVGHNFNTRMTRFVIRTENHLHDFMSGLVPSTFDDDDD